MMKTGRKKRSDSILLLVICLTFMLFPFMFYAFIALNPIEAFALDSSGRIFIGQKPTVGSQIQVFNETQFLYSFKNVTERGYKMTIQNDELLIYTGSSLYHLDLNGNVLEKENRHPITKNWGRTFLDSEGNTYYLKTFGRDKIIRNNQEIIFQQSKHDWIISLFFIISFPLEFFLIIFLLDLTGVFKSGYHSK